MILSCHFMQNWQRRVGGLPTELLVKTIVKNSIRVQHGRIYYLQDGSVYKRLAMYWHPDMNIIIQIDAQNDVAVSVLSKRMTKSKRRRPAARKRRRRF